MENRIHFHTLDELIRALDKERKLLKEMFGNRKTMSTFRYELARDYASRKEESLDFLRRYGVIRDNGDGVELEDVYLKFFEDVLEVNEEINVASVKESIDNLNNSIEFYLIETAPNKKQTHLKDVKRILQNIALNILRSVIDLKRNIDSTYKNEPTIADPINKRFGARSRAATARTLLALFSIAPAKNGIKITLNQPTIRHFCDASASRVSDDSACNGVVLERLAKAISK